jgi:tRNA1Val (adenine37-N6)-methyltransferase
VEDKVANLPGTEETLDDLIIGGLKLIQPRKGYRFSIDAVLLAHFANLDKVKQAVDLGCGNGVIPLILAARSPGLKLLGVEIQEKMVERARRSVEYNHLEKQIEIVWGDFLNIDKYLPSRSAELVLSNPPFWSKGEGHLSRNPEEALARHEIAMTLNDLLRAAAYLLGPGGSFCIIHRAERLGDVLRGCQVHKLVPVRLRTIHSFWYQEAKLILVEAQKRERGQLKILPPLIIYNKPGKYSEEIAKIYYAGEER